MGKEKNRELKKEKGRKKKGKKKDCVLWQNSSMNLISKYTKNSGGRLNAGGIKKSKEEEGNRKRGKKQGKRKIIVVKPGRTVINRIGKEIFK